MPKRLPLASARRIKAQYLELAGFTGNNTLQAVQKWRNREKPMNSMPWLKDVQVQTLQRQGRIQDEDWQLLRSCVPRAMNGGTGFVKSSSPNGTRQPARSNSLNSLLRMDLHIILTYCSAFRLQVLIQAKSTKAQDCGRLDHAPKMDRASLLVYGHRTW